MQELFENWMNLEKLKILGQEKKKVKPCSQRRRGVWINLSPRNFHQDDFQTSCKAFEILFGIFKSLHNG